MERARATWTDERLDDFVRRVEVGFNRIDSLGARIDAMQRTMLQIGGGILAANLGAIVTLIATRV